MAGMFEQIPPLDQRALEDGGTEFLAGVVHFRNRLLTPTPMKIARMRGMSDTRIQSIGRALENAGYVELEYIGPASVKNIKLTPKGERCAQELGLDVGMMA